MRCLLPFTLIVAALVTGCSSSNTCENIEDINAQRRECEELSKRIRQTESVVVRTNLQEIYEKQCVDIRFYRDGFDDSHICSTRDRDEQQPTEE
ncbi:hypothetical protein K0504_15295 [Neiella marina]|uniref:Lipoprotein n=1 Tax=Neiella holothuriorum TaxID=2870530 RepID=A0ABS7EJ69_9GAMM|nr:hypothetical protein [Neiella holothuriorum]MBW8192402.1 hypothetical protein [Neiella holothuriorum]